MPTVEFVIPAWREVRNIRRLIPQLEEQIKKLPAKYTITAIWLITHDKPTGKAGKKADTLGLVKHILVDRKKGGKIASLNTALKKVTAEIVVFLDGDVTLAKNAIYYLLERLTNNENTAAVVGRPAPLNPKNTMVDFWAHVLTHSAHRMRETAAKHKKLVNITGNLYAVKRNYLPESFDLRCADDAFITFYIASKGGFIDYEPRALAYQYFPRTYRTWLMQKLRNLKGEATSQKIIRERFKTAPHSMRTFIRELRYFYYTLEVPKSLIEWTWFIVLYFARLHMWFLHFLNPYVKSEEQSPWFKWKKVGKKQKT